MVPGRLHIALEVRQGRHLEKSDGSRPTRRGRRRLSVATGAGAGVAAGVAAGLPSMMRGAAAASLHHYGGGAESPRPSRQPRRRLPGVRGCPAPSISPRGAGPVGVGQSAVGGGCGGSREPPSLPLSLSLSRCGLITALAAWAPNILPLPEDSPRNVPAPAATGRPARLPRAASSSLPEKSR